MRKVLKEAVAQGIVVVGATGDRSRPSNKCFADGVPRPRHPGAVAVRAGGQDGQAWEFNPRPVRSFVDGNPMITAPGVDVTGIRLGAGQRLAVRARAAPARRTRRRSWPGRSPW